VGAESYAWPPGTFGAPVGAPPGAFPGASLGAYMTAGSSSFADFLATAAPELLPRPVAPAVLPGSLAAELPHGTTIVAAACDGGVVMAGDRRATAGNVIMQRDIDKVYQADEFSAVGVAGVAGVGIELVRLFQVELEEYEKLEGHALSLDGKANRLASFVRGNIGAAMQGLVAVPLFAGYDEDAGIGRIFSYDVSGGRYEEHRFHAIGSGSVFARGSLKKLYSEGMPAADAVLACMQALYDAADDDSATGGPDMSRHIYPVIATISADGYQRLTDEAVGQYASTVVDGRMAEPDGPIAPLRPAGSPGELPSS
jgi:proteasome beta subunit